MKNKHSNSLGNIAIFSSCTEDWGGSEELWGRSVPILIEMGYEVTVYKVRINRNHPEFLKLASRGVKFEELDNDHSFFRRNLKRVIGKLEQLGGKGYMFSFAVNPWVKRFSALLKKNKHVFAIFSQGINFDGLGYASACLSIRLPYVLIAQKAVDFYWPSREDRPMMKKILKGAAACYFVSKHNLTLTEEQFGIRLENGHVIFNPQKIGTALPYPSTTNGYRLACVGRLFVLDKGQDILIRILSKDRWRNRPLTISFIGSGVDDQGLQEMATLLDVKNVSFVGQVNDMDALWREYHALVLPSRSEGLPLSMVEAMAAGRIAIISNAGGNTELIDENVTAFSAAPYEAEFEKAMDRAWQERERWEILGKIAVDQISRRVPKSPENEFVKHVLNVIDGTF